jgi:predicted O-methyltransferase YrrM
MMKQNAECRRLAALVGVEIGVDKGLNALSILSCLPMKHLYLIDPYTPYMQEGKLVESGEETFRTAQQNLKMFSNYVFLRQSSGTAWREIKESLDFVYLDGNHQYEAVKQDLANYYPLVKDGGMVGGHDYDDCDPHPRGVVRAVQEFARENKLEVNHTFPDFWLFKE